MDFLLEIQSTAEDVRHGLPMGDLSQFHGGGGNAMNRILMDGWCKVGAARGGTIAANLSLKDNA